MAKKSKDAAEEKAREKGKATWKIMGTAASLTAGFAATKALDATWKTATGRKPPTSPESPEIGNREALAWAALTGLSMGVARMYATRRAANYWYRSFGVLPPGMNKAATKKTREKVK